jgi:hypothetical protein
MKKASLCIVVFRLGFNVHSQIVDIPDVKFKDALLYSNCVDSNDDGIPDMDADLNNDGEIQTSEAEAVIGLYVDRHLIDSMEGIQSFVNIEVLDISVSYITTIDLSQNVNLREVYAESNYYTTELDFSSNPNLKILNCQGNIELESLNVTQNSDLELLYCGASSLSNLDVSQNIMLKELYSDFSLLSSVDVSNNINLEFFSCSGDSLLSVDVTNNPNLIELYCYSIELSSLDLTQNPNLLELHYGGGNMTSLDLSQNINLEVMTCSLSKFPTLDFSNNPNLIWFYGVSTQLIELDFSQNPNLEGVTISSSLLENLNIQNGNNEILDYFRIVGNPNLYCVQVDNVEDAYDYPGWQRDPQTLYSENCNLNIEDISHDLDIVIYPNPVFDLLQIETKSFEILSVRIYNSLGEILLNEIGNNKQIDVTRLSGGLLFVEVNTEKGYLNKKIIKE